MADKTPICNYCGGDLPLATQRMQERTTLRGRIVWTFRHRSRKACKKTVKRETRRIQVLSAR